MFCAGNPTASSLGQIALSSLRFGYTRLEARFRVVQPFGQSELPVDIVSVDPLSFLITFFRLAQDPDFPWSTGQKCAVRHTCTFVGTLAGEPQIRAYLAQNVCKHAECGKQCGPPITIEGCLT